MRTKPVDGRQGDAKPSVDAPRLAGDGGAVLVEMAIISPFLFLIVFSIIEFGYGYGQSLDVRYGAREASRLVAVNYRETAVTGAAQRTQIINAACERMQIVGGDGTTVEMGFVGSGSNAKDRGEFAFVQVRRPLQQITSFLNFALDNVVLTSRVETRLEQDATWDATGSPVTCP